MCKCVVCMSGVCESVCVSVWYGCCVHVCVPMNVFRGQRRLSSLLLYPIETAPLTEPITMLVVSKVPEILLLLSLTVLQF